MPSKLIAQLGRMLSGETSCQHVTVTILTNSRDTTDWSIVDQVNSHVLAALFDHAAKARNRARAATLHYYEYRRPASEQVRTLHSKVWVLGDDILIGSANADLRSFMMDSNNGVLIQNAPSLIAKYLAFIDGIRLDSMLVKQLTYTPDTRDEVIVADLSRIRQLLRKNRLAPYLSDVGWAAIESQFRRIVDQAFELTQIILRGGPGSQSAGEKFDTMFKMI